MRASLLLPAGVFTRDGKGGEGLNRGAPLRSPRPAPTLCVTAFLSDTCGTNFAPQTLSASSKKPELCSEPPISESVQILDKMSLSFLQGFFFLKHLSHKEMREKWTGQE